MFKALDVVVIVLPPVNVLPAVRVCCHVGVVSPAFGALPNSPEVFITTTESVVADIGIKPSERTVNLVVLFVFTGKLSAEFVPTPKPDGMAGK